MAETAPGSRRRCCTDAAGAGKGFENRAGSVQSSPYARGRGAERAGELHIARTSG
jgi:hypothetical protein